MSTWAVGDVQGCFGTLEKLLAAVGFGDGDRLWLAGDLVNRGPRNLEVLRFARDLGDRCVAVLGNHDLHLLATAAGLRKRKPRDTLDDVLEAPDGDELLAWLRARPLFHRDGDHALVHAGLLPRWTVDDAARAARRVEARVRAGEPAFLRPRPGKSDDPDAVALCAFVFLRSLSRDGVPDLGYAGPLGHLPDGNIPWFAFPGRKSKGTKILFGHWAMLGFHEEQDTVCLDSGCVWGGALTAYRLEDGRRLSVPLSDPVAVTPP